MGGYDGIGLCTPSAASKAAKYLPVHITAITANNQKITTDSSVRYTQNIELSYKENNLSFEFSDYSYDHIKKGNFVYKLEGLDKDWHQVDERSNRISYTNIPHGKYTLFIRHAGDRQKICFHAFGYHSFAVVSNFVGKNGLFPYYRRIGRMDNQLFSW